MMTIGQFAQSTGLSAKALRLYDEMGLLTPADVDATTGYRRYHPHQVRHGAQLAVMRRMGVPLELAGQVLSDPDRAEDLFDHHAAQVHARHQAERAALAAGRALLQSYDRPALLQRRRASAQPWVGAVLDVPADPGGDPGTAGSDGGDAAELGDEAANATFAALHSALVQAGSTVSGPWWTTLRAGPDPARVQVVLCWPVSQLPAGGFAVPGVQVEVGVLPERTEALVQVLHEHDDPGAEDDDVMAGLPVAAVVHLEEQLTEGDEVLDGQVRQVGVLGADGTPVGVELVVTVGVHSPRGHHGGGVPASWAG